MGIPKDIEKGGGSKEIWRLPYCLSSKPPGVEPSKPRALWDGRYGNEFCRDLPFSMDNAAKVAEVAWGDVYFFKIDHKNG